MLTIQVDDVRLEAELTQRAQATGKPTQQLVEELLAEALTHPAPPALDFARLDPRQHSHLLQFAVDPLTDDDPAFQHVTDTTLFVNELRRNAWKR
jgi:hypothetical protein